MFGWAASVTMPHNEQPRLPALAVDPERVSIGGISTGADLAANYLLAHSASTCGAAFGESHTETCFLAKVHNISPRHKPAAPPKVAIKMEPYLKLWFSPIRYSQLIARLILDRAQRLLTPPAFACVIPVVAGSRDVVFRRLDRDRHASRYCKLYC